MKTNAPWKSLTSLPKASDPAVSAELLPYMTPVLKEFGSIRKLTLGSGTYNTDGMSGKAKSTSDRRLKEGIARIGDHPKGFGIYLFSYKAAHQERCGAGRFVGVMADEVETVLPDAVSVGADGFKMVDYALIPSCNNALY